MRRFEMIAFALTSVLFLFGCSRGSSLKTTSAVQTTQSNEAASCVVSIDNAQNIALNNSGTDSPMNVSIFTYPVGAAATLLSATWSSPSGAFSVPLNTKVTVRVSNSPASGEFVAQIDGAAGRAICSARYQLVSSYTQPGGPLSNSNLHASLLGFDAVTGFWFKRNSAGQMYPFGKFPIGIIFDRVGAGDFNGDGLIDVIAREQSTGKFYLGLDGTAMSSAVVAFTHDLTKPMANFRVADVSGDNRADVVYDDANAISLSYRPSIDSMGVLSFAGPIANPITIDVTVAPTGMIPYRAPATISWTSQNAVSCLLRNAAGAPVVAANGAGVSGKNASYITAPLTQSTSFTVECTNEYQSPYSKSATLNVAPKLEGSVSMLLSADYALANTNITVTLGAQNVVLASCRFTKDGANLPLPNNGIATVMVNPTNTFKFACNDTYGDLQSIEKKVYPPALMTPNVQSLAFGSVYQNQEKIIEIVFTNNHPVAAIQLAELTISAAPFTITETNCRNALIPVGGRCTAKVKAVPPLVQAYSANLILNFNNKISAATLVIPASVTGAKQSKK